MKLSWAVATDACAFWVPCVDSLGEDGLNDLRAIRLQAVAVLHALYWGRNCESAPGSSSGAGSGRPFSVQGLRAVLTDTVAFESLSVGSFRSQSVQIDLGTEARDVPLRALIIKGPSTRLRSRS